MTASKHIQSLEFRLKVLRILFWNLFRKDLRTHVCEAANEFSPDVIILIESSEDSEATLSMLKAKVSSEFYIPISIANRFQFFSRYKNLDLSELHGDDRLTLRRLKYAETEFLLGAVHVVDRRNWDPQNQAAQVCLLASEIRRKEDAEGHDRTIIIGDFNMNPFDNAMHIAQGLNAMMTAKIAERGSRKLQNTSYRFFYNPMWNLLGDRTPGPSGTYYHSSSSQGLHGWNMLDQVILGRSAIPFFDNVEILTSSGDTDLRTESGRPNKAVASDHFPILVTLK